MSIYMCIIYGREGIKEGKIAEWIGNGAVKVNV